MRVSRAGRTGGSWYGSYDIFVNGRPRTTCTSMKWAERSARENSILDGEADIRVWDCDEVEWRVTAVFRNGKRVRSSK